MNTPTEPQSTGIYRARDGMIFGVCKGLARSMDVGVGWVRLLAVLLLVFGGIWIPIGLYILAAIIMKPEPVLPLESASDREFYHSYVSSRSMALERLKRTFDNLDRRIQRMESIVTAPDYDWDRRFNE
jgi:phage shock protein C